jgi:hypothetical protein
MTTVVLPHTLVRSAALPMGLALVWLGYALWAERRQDPSDGPVATYWRLA